MQTCDRLCVGDRALVSVVIPAKNNGSTIKHCLGSIRGQTYREIEIILVDGFSTDDTVRISENMHAKVIPLEGERMKAKNHGLRICRGRYVCFIDSDMILEERVIEQCVESCKANVAGVIVPERSIGNGLWVGVRDFERSLYSGSKIESARFFDREIALQAGGFDEDVIAYEESTLPQKIEALGYRVDGRISDSILHDEGNFKLKKWLLKKQYYGKTTTAYLKKYPEYGSAQLGIKYRIAVMTGKGQWRTLLRYPLKSVGLFTLKFLEYLYSR
ncbi:MAG: glycosyltransferase family 2 protein [Nitrososphaera sp.]